MAETFDLEDNLIPSKFYNADNNPWQTTSAQANGGTYSMASNSSLGNNSFSNICIVGDFAAGDFDCSYLISSESGFDFGVILVDGTAVATVSGAGSWTAMTTQTLSAGIHVIQFVYYKDNSGTAGDDRFYIDDITVPDFTDLQGDLETFSSGVPAGWTNDATYPWAAASTSETPNTGLKSSNGAVNSSTGTLSYSSDSADPAGTIIVFGRASSEATFDFFKVDVDTSEVYSDDGDNKYPTAFVSTVTSGSHDYDFKYTKDGSGNSFLDAAFLDFFYHPGYTSDSGTTISATLETINLSALNPTVTALVDSDISATLATITLSSLNPNIEALVNTNVSATLDNVNIASLNPIVTINTDTNISATLGAVTLNTLAPSVEVLVNTDINATLANLSISAINPVVTTGANVNINATAEAMMIAALNPSVTGVSDYQVNATLATLSISPFNTAVQSGELIELETFGLSVTIIDNIGSSATISNDIGINAKISNNIGVSTTIN